MPIPFAAWLNTNLRQGTQELGTFRIGDGGGAAVLTAVIPTAYLQGVLRDGIETAEPDNDVGIIRRTLPVAHPQYPWLFLKNVDNVVGKSFIQKVAADPDGVLEVGPMPYFSDYQEYEAQLSFEPRPYALITDDSVQLEEFAYYDSTGAVVDTEVWTEWWRYVEWLRAPAAEYLTADKGQFKWGIVGGGASDPTDNTSAGTGQIRILVPASVYHVNWYKVPYNYVLSSNTYFDRFIGHINQNAWEGFTPGQGLLQAVNVTRVYTPPFPEFDSYLGYNTVSQNKLCDLEFVILSVERVGHNLPTPVNNSHIAGGHNLAAFAPNGKYYYIENFRSGAPGTGTPVYPSVPFELLFQNPDWF